MGTDQIRLIGTRNGIFTVKSAYNILLDESHQNGSTTMFVFHEIDYGVLNYLQKFCTFRGNVYRIVCSQRQDY